VPGNNFLVNLPKWWHMKPNSRRFLVAFSLLCLLYLHLLSVFPFTKNHVLAQSADSPWLIYKEDGGLASNNVLAILPSDGEIWFGTENGISRFTGEWTSWKGSETFVEGMVNALAKDAKQTIIWAGTDLGHVAEWNGQKWTAVLKLPSAVQALHTVDGQLWVGTGQGLYIWNGSEAVPVSVLADRSVQSLASHANTVWVGTDYGIWLYHRQAWTHITTEEGLPGNDINTVWLDPSGPVWIGATEGLARLEPLTGAWIKIETENAEGSPYNIQALTGDGNGDLWGGTNGDGAFAIVEGQFVAFSGDIGLTTRFVEAVAVDQDGSIWFGTASGAFRYNQNIWVKEMRDPAEFPGINLIDSLLVDDNNRLWIGTRGAGIRLKDYSSRPSFVNPETIFISKHNQLEDEEFPFHIRTDLPTNQITHLIQDYQGNIWAATQKGVARYDEGAHHWRQPVKTNTLPSESVNVLAVDQSNLWIGTAAGLAHYEFESNKVITVEELAGQNIKALAVDSMKRIWAGTLDSGLFVRHEDNVWRHYQASTTQTNTVSGNAIVALASDRSGGMWVAVNRQGLNYWYDGEWIDYTSQGKLPSNILYTLYTDPADGSLWIGSEGGLTRYDGRTWETYNVEGILPLASIFSITRTRENSYWVGGKDGLTFYRLENTSPWIRINAISGAHTSVSGDLIQIQTDTQIGLRLVAGDLFTAAADLYILYRLSGPGQIGEWVTLDGRFLQLPEFQQEGKYLVELLARDQAFNYSEPVRVGMDVILPPPTVTLPFLAPIRRDMFIALMITGFIGLIGFGYMSIEIIQSRRRTREALIRGYNPFVSGEPVRRQDMFFGRHDLLQRIVDTLHNNSIMIHGERRIGKTTILYQLAARLREVDDDDYWFIPLYVDLEGTTEESFFHFLLEEILNGALTLPNARQWLKPELQDLLYDSVPATEYSDREFSRDLRVIIQALQTYSEISHPNKQLRLILLLDEMDVMSSYSRLVQQRLRRIFMRDFAATLGAVVAGIQISKEWDRVESPWFNLFNEIQLGPFNREQALQLLVEPIYEYYRYDPAALEFIIENSDGRPYRLQQYALEAVNHMLAANRRVITLDDAEYAHEDIQGVGENANAGLGFSKHPDSAEDKLPDSLETIDDQDGTAEEEDSIHHSTTQRIENA
jgi:ligand-binding sensor domain-containing protein